MGAFYIAAVTTTEAGPLTVSSTCISAISRIVCNTTVQCVAIDPTMVCSNSLCVCPSSSLQPITSGDGLCNFTAASLFPLSLGAACTADANCSSSALCLAGECSCPPGFQPWDEHNCTAVPQTIATSGPWMALSMLLSGVVIIILLVIWFCAFTQWSYGLRWAKTYAGGKESAPTLHVWSQASMGDLTASVPMAPMQASQNTDSVGTPHDTAASGQRSVHRRFRRPARLVDGGDGRTILGTDQPADIDDRAARVVQRTRRVVRAARAE
ncbi:hypothetical protein MRX96_045287 [Rhipicephalus microplus]